VNSAAQRVVIFFSKGCSFELVGRCLEAVREFSVEPIWYHGIPAPIPPSTNSVVLEALADLESATTIVVVGTESPVTPGWLKRPVARRLEQGARFFEYHFLVGDQQQSESSADGESHPSTAASVQDLQDLFRSALRSMREGR
jgi:hypothetical protein